MQRETDTYGADGGPVRVHVSKSSDKKDENPGNFGLGTEEV